MKIFEKTTKKNEITKETADENDSLIVCYQYLSNYILKLTSNSTNFSRNLQAEIIEPFNLVLQNFANTNKEISSSTSLVLFFTRFDFSKPSKLLKNVENSIKNAKKWQEKYYKAARAVEKSEDFLDKIKKKIEKTESYKEELSKANSISIF